MMRGCDTTAGRHRFNTDLLVNPGDLETARGAFPRTQRAARRPRPAWVRSQIRLRSNSALCEAPHKADDAERVIMRSRALYSDRTAA
jgi:hypothetical protein